VDFEVNCNWVKAENVARVDMELAPLIPGSGGGGGGGGGGHGPGPGVGAQP